MVTRSSPLPNFPDPLPRCGSDPDHHLDGPTKHQHCRAPARNPPPSPPPQAALHPWEQSSALPVPIPFPPALKTSCSKDRLLGFLSLGTADISARGCYFYPGNGWQLPYRSLPPPALPGPAPARSGTLPAGTAVRGARTKPQSPPAAERYPQLGACAALRFKRQ